MAQRLVTNWKGLRGSYESKKVKLAKAGKQTKWAPFWTVLKKFGKGKKVHPSSLTHVKRNWRHTKLKIKPRKLRKDFLG